MAIRLNILNQLCGIGYKISPIGCDMRAGALRTLLLEKYVEKILLHNNSIINLFQEIDHDTQKYELFDVSLIASATRNIMETANMYCYFSERKIAQDEIEFRYYVSCLNQDKNKHTILEKIGVKLTDSWASHLHRTSKFQYIQVLEHNNFFMSLSDKEKERILSGKNPTHKISSPGILPQNIESGVYNLLSNSVHSLMLGMNSASLDNVHIFRGLFSPLWVLEISIEMCVLYFSHVLLDYLDIRKRLYRTISKTELEFLKKVHTTTPIENWVNTIQSFFEKTEFDKAISEISKNNLK